VGEWPGTREELIEEQLRLAALDPLPWWSRPAARIGAVFVCFPRGSSGPGRPEIRPGRPRTRVATPSTWVAAPALRTSRACSRSAKEPCWRPPFARSHHRRIDDPNFLGDTQVPVEPGHYSFHPAPGVSNTISVAFRRPAR
jgi:hypothetical protein